MALIECPECKKSISDQAKLCVGCGFPIKEDTFSFVKNNFNKLGDATSKNSEPECAPFYVLVKSELYIAVNLLNDSAGEEIRQLQADGFEIVADDCMAKDQHEAIKQAKLGFTWWSVWGALGAFSSFLYLMFSIVNGEYFVSFILFLFCIGAYFVLKKNKYAFLVLTICTLNPLLWLINGIYLKNRWNHPTVNKN